jgi:hypothetical protein
MKDKLTAHVREKEERKAVQDGKSGDIYEGMVVSRKKQKENHPSLGDVRK